MNIIRTTAYSAALFLASSLAMACDYPQRPFIPDGANASKDQLLEAKNGVQSFIGAVDDYLTCIENEAKAEIEALDNPTQEEMQSVEDNLNRQFDAANEEKALVGEQFNQQIRAYNQKIKESKESE